MHPQAVLLRMVGGEDAACFPERRGGDVVQLVGSTDGLTVANSDGSAPSETVPSSGADETRPPAPGRPERPLAQRGRAEGVDDEQLIGRIAGGDEEAMKRLYDRYSAVVYTLALRMTNSPEEAEEVLQDAFVRLFDNAGRYRAKLGTVKTYLYSIARNLAISRLRARTSRPRKALGHDLHDPSWSWSHHPPADGVTRIAVRDALAQLSAEEVALLEAAFYQGYSHSQLAERSGLPLGTLKSKLRRALLKMRALLEDA